MLTKLRDRPWQNGGFVDAIVSPGQGGPHLLSFALFGLGVRSFVTGSLIPGWQPLIKTASSRPLAMVDAVVLVILAGMMLVGWKRRIGAFGISVLLALWIVGLQSPGVFAAPTDIALWLGVAEVGAISAAALLIALDESSDGAQVPRAATVVRILFGLCALVFGLSHFVYADLTATMVPSWLPVRLGWAYATGAAHMAAGLAIASGFQRRTASGLLALMMACFVLLVHVPRVIASDGSLVEWTFLLDACALCGASWTVASTTPRKSTHSIVGRLRATDPLCSPPKSLR